MASPVRASTRPDLPRAFVLPGDELDERVFEGRDGFFEAGAAFSLVFKVFFRVVVETMGHSPCLQYRIT
jgi:hypothetical protein